MATFTSVPEFPDGPLAPADQPGAGYIDPRLAVGGQPGRYSDQQSGPSFYPDFTVRTVYLGSTGLAQMPVAGALGTPARVVRLTAPYAKKIVWWRAYRLGQKPMLPHYDTGTTNEALGWFMILPYEGVLLAGGENYSFVVEGLYLYYLFAVPCLTDDFYAGVTPLFTATTEDMKVQGYQFSRTLLRAKPPAPYTGTDDQQFLSGKDPGEHLGGIYPGP